MAALPIGNFVLFPADSTAPSSGSGLEDLTEESADGVFGGLLLKAQEDQPQAINVDEVSDSEVSESNDVTQATAVAVSESPVAFALPGNQQLIDQLEVSPQPSETETTLSATGSRGELQVQKDLVTELDGLPREPDLPLGIQPDVQLEVPTEAKVLAPSSTTLLPTADEQSIESAEPAIQLPVDSDGESPAFSIQPTDEVSLAPSEPIASPNSDSVFELPGDQAFVSAANGVSDQPQIELPEPTSDLTVSSNSSIEQPVQPIEDHFQFEQSGAESAGIGEGQTQASTPPTITTTFEDEEPELDVETTVDRSGESIDLENDSVRSISQQLDTIANRRQQTIDSSDLTQVADLRTQRSTSDLRSITSVAVDQPSTASPILTNSVLPTFGEIPPLAAADSTVPIASLPPNHGLQKIVSELALESTSVVDSKTISVSFDEPNIGKVQLDMTESTTGMSVNVAASDEVTLEMLTANAANLERSLRDHNIELLEIASMPMDTATYNQPQTSQQFHRDTQETYQQNSEPSLAAVEAEQELSNTAPLSFRA